MIKLIKVLLIILITSIGFCFLAKTFSEEIDVFLEAKILSPSNVEIGKNIIFDASQSINNIPNAKINYSWDLGDGTESKEEEIVHIYKNPGKHKVILRVYVEKKNQWGTERIEDIYEKEIFVYRRIFALITDSQKEKEKIKGLVKLGEEEGTLLDITESKNTVSPQKEILTKLIDKTELLRRAKISIVWAKDIRVLTSLNKIKKTEAKEGVDFSNKTIILISDGGMSTLKNIVQTNFNILRPKQIIITRKEAIDEVFTTENEEEFLRLIQERGYDYQVINEDTIERVGIVNFMSKMINFVRENGVSDETVIFILLIPVILTIIAFLRQFIGLSTFGIYIPAIVTLVFLNIGFRVGIVFIVFILLINFLVKKLLKKYHLLYLPKVAIVVSVSSLVVLLLLVGAVRLGIEQVLNMPIIPLLIAAITVEKFTNLEASKGVLPTVVLIGESLFSAAVCYLLVRNQLFHIFLLGHPEIIFLFIGLDVFLGRFTGLKIFEFIRFKEVFGYSEEE